MNTLEKAFEEFDSKFSTKTKRLATFESINDLFKEIAISVFYGGYFLVNKKIKIYPVDIEFYLYGERPKDPEWMKDYNMYHYGGNVPYFPKAGSLHPHRSGVDVTFENEDKEYRASFLIRAYRNGPKGEKETHPTYLREEMFGEASFSGKGLNIKWVNKPSGEVVDLDVKARFRLKGKDKKPDKKPWRFIKKEI